MNLKDLYGDFILEIVNIGIPHYTEKNRLFYLTGLVIEIDSDFLTLKRNDGLKKIPFCDILEIRRKNKID
jgi:hypothetical protein